MFLCYHGVTKQVTRSPTDPTGLHVNHRRFVAQLDFLVRHYHIISLQEYLTARRHGHRLPNYSLVLTFDDGFRNFFTAAAPLLAARGLPATVFLITDKAYGATEVNGNGGWRPEDDSRHMSWAEARVLRQERGIEFGSHTRSHSRLLTLSPAEAEQELQCSYNDLVSQLGVKAPALSYPKGEYSELLAAQARKLGYACAFITQRGQNEFDHDLFSLGRVLIGDDDDKAAFAVRISGLRWWLVKVRAPLAWLPTSKSHKVLAGSQVEPSLKPAGMIRNPTPTTSSPDFP
jgi:peptidoglycan/xylan/chitin deacetylase (PgdA/CDA1 family)